MVNVADAELFIAGTVISVQPISDRGTGEFRGHKVTIISSDGLAVVKVDPSSPLEASEGRYVVWVIRNSAYSIEGNSGMSTRYVRAATVEELERVLDAARRNSTKADKTAA